MKWFKINKKYIFLKKGWQWNISSDFRSVFNVPQTTNDQNKKEMVNFDEMMDHFYVFSKSEKRLFKQKSELQLWNKLGITSCWCY